MSEIYDDYTATSVFDLGKEEEVQLRYRMDHFQQYLLPHMPADKNARVLDIGCGFGGYLKALQDHGYQNVAGVDLSEAQIAYAKRKFGLKDVVCQDALAYLEEHREAYDVILLCDVLEHLEIEASIKMIKLVHAALKEGGVCIVKVPNGVAPFTPHLYGDVTHYRAYTPRSLRQSLRMGGFAKESITCHDQLPYIHGSIFFLPLSIIRKLFWVLLVKPGLYILLMLLYGDDFEAIYTDNVIAVGRK